jgi:hypothetical protein
MLIAAFLWTAHATAPIVAVSEKAAGWLAERGGARFWQAPATKAIVSRVTWKVLSNNSVVLGTVGETATARFMQAKGYIRLDPSATKHGLDGLYVKTNWFGGLKEAVIVEVKTKNLAPGFGRFPPLINPTQMSTTWIKRALARIDQSGLTDKERRLLAEVAKGVEENNSIVRRELWRHDVKFNQTVRYELKQESTIAVSIGGRLEASTEGEVLRSVIEEQCALKVLACGSSLPSS